MACRDSGFEGKTETLSLAVRLDEIGRAIAWLEELSERDGWPERTRFALELSLEEALTNVIMHGFTEETSSAPVLSVDCARQPDMIRLHVTDNGTPFDPTSLEEKPLPLSIESAVIGGHGIRLMRRMLDEFSYRRIDGLNRLSLGRRLDREDQSPPA